MTALLGAGCDRDSGVHTTPGPCSWAQHTGPERTTFLQLRVACASDVQLRTVTHTIASAVGHPSRIYISLQGSVSGPHFSSASLLKGTVLLVGLPSLTVSLG